MAKGKPAPKGAFETNGLTEMDKFLLEQLEYGPATVVEITKRMGIVHDFKIREALIGRLTRLEGQGYVRGSGSPKEWGITSRGEEAIA